MKNMNKFKFVVDGTKRECATTLEDVLGVRKKMDLPYESKEDLESGLKKMNLLDMQDFAVKIGIKPNNDRPRLFNSIVNQYIKLTRTYGSLINDSSSKNFDPNSF